MGAGTLTWRIAIKFFGWKHKAFMLQRLLHSWKTRDFTVKNCIEAHQRILKPRFLAGLQNDVYLSNHVPIINWPFVWVHWTGSTILGNGLFLLARVLCRHYLKCNINRRFGPPLLPRDKRHHHFWVPSKYLCKAEADFRWHWPFQVPLSFPLPLSLIHIWRCRRRG